MSHNSKKNFSSLVELLSLRASDHPNKTLFNFLLNGEEEISSLSFSQLDTQARTVAAALQSRAKAGDKVLLLYPQSLEFVAAFFGCLYAGMVAVPTYPPDPSKLNRTIPRLQALIQDAKPKAVLTTSAILSKLGEIISLFPDLQNMYWLSIEGLSKEMASQWVDPNLNQDSLAFLQYTSGSTSTPKGVMVSHGNLLYNISYIEHSFELSPSDVAVSWLPAIHDMGLIDGILGPVYYDYLCYLMSPMHFLQKPIRWLAAISKHKATRTGAPNFAYELCIRKISDEQKQSLDLSSLSNVYNGAEPIRQETLDNFSRAFSSCGFKSSAFYPCYGLAEATLMVTGAKRFGGYVSCSVEREALWDGRIRFNNESMDSLSSYQSLVSSGIVRLETKVLIVDPDTLLECQADKVGEIWVSGPTIAKGYWGKDKETESTLRACLASGEGSFLRTGDLGFLNNGELYVTGRLKDLLIINGRNFYPQDIELTVEKSNENVRPGCCAAFSIEVDSTERLVLVLEVERRTKANNDSQSFSRKKDVFTEAFNSHPDTSLNLPQLITSILSAISQEHMLAVHAIAFIQAGTIFKTTSGKIQRQACRQAFLKNNLSPIHLWQSTSTLEVSSPEEKSLGNKEVESSNVQLNTGSHTSVKKKAITSKTPSIIQSWLISWIAKYSKIDNTSVAIDKPFIHFGLDSLGGTMLAQELEDWLGVSIPQTLIWDYPTISSVIDFLVNSEPTPNESLLSSPPVAINNLLSEIEDISDTQAKNLLSDLKDKV